MLITLSVKPTGEKKDYAEVGVRSQKKLAQQLMKPLFIHVGLLTPCMVFHFPVRLNSLLCDYKKPYPEKKRQWIHHLMI